MKKILCFLMIAASFLTSSVLKAQIAVSPSPESSQNSQPTSQPDSQPALRFDFSSTAALRKTCAALDLENLAFILKQSEDYKTAVVVCRGVRFLEQAVERTFRRNEQFSAFDLVSNLEGTRRNLGFLLEHIQKTREILESVHLSGEGLTIFPGRFELDLNGNLSINSFEKHFFWAPKPGVKIPWFGTWRNEMRARDAKLRTQTGYNPDDIWSSDELALSRYYTTFFNETEIQIDAADIEWAVAYCHLAEMTLNVLLAYDFRTFELTSPDRVSTLAYGHALKAIQSSRKLRALLLQETRDFKEWIPNPDQKNTVFPMVLDQNLFKNWGILLDQFEELLTGKTLLGGIVKDANGKELFDFGRLSEPNCKEGQGINLQKLFQKPIKTFNDLNIPLCEAVASDKAVSKLADTLTEIFQRNFAASGAPSDQWEVQLDLLRYLYWVN